MPLASHISPNKDIYTLQNDSIEIKVKKTGAELCSIKLLSTNQEYMWEADPAIWGNSSPVLFPIVGMLKDQTYILDGQKYFMKKHGIFKYSPDVKLASSTDDSLTFKLLYNEETLKQYPFKFEYLLTFKLEKCKVIIINEVKNLGEKEMYFTLGAHPAFKCPLDPGEKYDDYFLEFEQPETAYTYPLLPSSGLLGEKTDLLLNNSRILELSYHLFDKDALVFKDIQSKSVTLSSKISGKRVRVDFEDYPYLGFWAKPNADYVCIEPWYGVNDPVITDQNFKTKEGILKLDSKSTFTATYSISVIQ
ncbi:MAG: aldose 1-epimerase family protein [Paludibacter sp.]|nr:aldose 1-epimerase family protein [Paludibacter sp.]